MEVQLRSSLEPGCNPKETHIPPVNIIISFSSIRTMPIIARILHGSILDVSSIEIPLIWQVLRDVSLLQIRDSTPLIMYRD